MPRIRARGATQRHGIAPSTVGRGRSVPPAAPSDTRLASWSEPLVSATCSDSLDHYDHWPAPTAIISDGGYGVLGFDGDTADHQGLPEWYEPHIRAWTEKATPQTTLWFWNSEVGWAAVHPILERHGWSYVNANVWNKGKGHIAGNVNTGRIRRFPVVTELCVQYVKEARIAGKSLKEWLLAEWKRAGLPLREANAACGVSDAATRKYLDQSHVWYFPPPEMFQRLQEYANERGHALGRPYFSINGETPLSASDWSRMRAKFNCPYGATNVWERPALRGAERLKVQNGRTAHLNQKPLDLMRLIIEASTDVGDVVWEPFGGLFSASIAARSLQRRSFAAEIDPAYFALGIQRLSSRGLEDA